MNDHRARGPQASSIARTEPHLHSHFTGELPPEHPLALVRLLRRHGF